MIKQEIYEGNILIMLICVACSVSSLYLNQDWLIINWTHRQVQVQLSMTFQSEYNDF